MKRFKLLGLALVAVFALAAAFSASAFALPELLGQGANATYEGKNTAANPTLETTKSEKIVCKEATANGVQETNSLASFHISFKGCESSGFKCNSSGDETGVILVLGSAHYVDSTPGNVAILFLFEELTIKCTALVTLKVKGDIVCPVLEALTSAATHEFHCTESAGKPSTTSWLNDENETQTAKVETSKNGGAFIESAEQALASVTFGTAVAVMNE